MTDRADDLWARLQAQLPSYDARVRRLGRQVSRSAVALTRSSVLPVPVGATAFWWDGHPNFGDALTPWILPHLGIVPVLSAPNEAEIAGVGSILEMLPPSFAGVVWGSGSLDGRRLNLPKATVAAVRGPLTRDLLGLPRGAPVALGDPGLLVERMMRRPRTKYALGVVPHGMHRRHPGFASLLSGSTANATQVLTYQPVHRVLRHIAECEAIFTTSLHGLIVADSFGIPAAWAMPSELYGGDFKFRDYEAVVTPGRTREISFDRTTTVGQVLRAVARADPARVEQSKDDLVRSVGLLPRRPLGEVVMRRTRRGPDTVTPRTAR